MFYIYLFYKKLILEEKKIQDIDEKKPEDIQKINSFSQLLFWDWDPKFIRFSIDKGILEISSIVDLVISEIILVPKEAKSKDDHITLKMQKSYTEIDIFHE